MAVLNIKLQLLLLNLLFLVEGKDVLLQYMFFPNQRVGYNRINTGGCCHPHFDPELPTRIFVADWPRNSFLAPITDFQYHYNNMGAYNQITVDHTEALVFYDPNLNRKVGDGGKELAKMLLCLTKTCKMQLNDTVVVGVGVGAHIAGSAGKYMEQWKEPKVSMIFGLDPTSDVEGNSTLSKTDATDVVVYHTNVNRTGIYQRAGTVDIYANDQTKQPNCQSDRCSHLRATRYFYGMAKWKLRKCEEIPETRYRICEDSKDFAEPGKDTDFKGLDGVYWLDTWWSECRDDNKQIRYREDYLR